MKAVVMQLGELHKNMVMANDRFIDSLYVSDMHIWIDEEYIELLIEALDIIACCSIATKRSLPLSFPLEREKFLIACAIFSHADSDDQHISLLQWKRKQAQKHRAIVDIEHILINVREQPEFKKFIQKFSFEDDLNLRE